MQYASFLCGLISQYIIICIIYIEVIFISYNLNNILKVKSIVTIICFIAFFYLAVTEKIGTDNFMLILSVITTYFFTKDKGGSV